jgi:hypothetical protein
LQVTGLAGPSEYWNFTGLAWLGTGWITVTVAEFIAFHDPVATDCAAVAIAVSRTAWRATAVSLQRAFRDHSEHTLRITGISGAYQGVGGAEVNIIAAGRTAKIGCRVASFIFIENTVAAAIGAVIVVADIAAIGTAAVPTETSSDQYGNALSVTGRAITGQNLRSTGALTLTLQRTIAIAELTFFHNTIATFRFGGLSRFTV